MQKRQGIRQKAKAAGPVRTVLLCLLPFALCLGAAIQAQRPAADAWPQFRGTPGLTGVATVAPPAALKVLWSYEAGDLVDSSPAIADSRVFVGVGSGHLVALNLSDGKEIWRYQVQQAIGESSPAVSGGIVYIGDLMGIVHAVNAADGKPIWTFKTGSEIKSSPVVVGDRVLIGSYDSKLYALSATDGKLLWTVETENYVHATPAVADGLVYLAGCDELFRAIRVSDGSIAFTVAFGANTGASPVVTGGRAYFGTFNNEVLALDLKTRKIVWRYEHADRHFPFYSSAAVTDGLVIIGGRDRMVHALDAASGVPRWTYLTRARVDSSPAVAGGRVFVGSSDNRFYVLGLAKGNKLFEFDTGSPVTSSPAVAGGRVVVASQDGRIICFG